MGEWDKGWWREEGGCVRDGDRFRGCEGERGRKS